MNLTNSHIPEVQPKYKKLFLYEIPMTRNQIHSILTTTK